MGVLLVGVWLIQTSDATVKATFNKNGRLNARGDKPWFHIPKDAVSGATCFFKPLRDGPTNFALGDYILDTKANRVGRVYKVVQECDDMSNPNYMMIGPLTLTCEKYKVQWMYYLGNGPRKKPKIYKKKTRTGNKWMREFAEPHYVRITGADAGAVYRTIKAITPQRRRLLTLEESHREMRNALRNQCQWY